jgi:hypothetical protein
MLQFHRSVALVRRTESSVQLGVDDPVLIDGLTAGDLSLIDRLCRGCEPDEYLEAAQRRGVSRTRALSLLDLLTEAGALAPSHAAAGGPVARDHVECFAALHGLGAVETARAVSDRPVFVVGADAAVVADALGATGFMPRPVASIDEALSAGAARALTVLVDRWTASVDDASRLFAEEADHVSIRLGDQQADLTPVRPGATPCLTCAVLHTRDEDEGWFTGWQQLRARSSHALVDPLLLRSAAVETARLLRAWAMGLAELGPLLRISARTGERSQSPARFHPDCDCRIPLSPSGEPGSVPGSRVRTAPA